MEVQTSCAGALKFYDSVAKAYHATKDDRYLDKISFTDLDGMHRFRPKMKKELWCQKSESKMNQLSENYKTAQPDELFWIDQPMDKFCDLITDKANQRMLVKLVKDGFPVPEHMKRYEYLVDTELIDEDDCYAGAIINVLTTREFEQKYNC